MHKRSSFAGRRPTAARTLPTPPTSRRCRGTSSPTSIGAASSRRSSITRTGRGSSSAWGRLLPAVGGAETSVPRDDPVYKLAEQRGFAKYPYDLARAERLLTDAGWTRGADGSLMPALGQRFPIEVRVVDSTPVNSRQGLALVDQ